MPFIYCAFLRLLPQDFHAAFGGAMLQDFNRRVGEARADGVAALTQIAVTELLSVVRCAGSEWLAKATAAPFERDMIFPDLSRMRPPCASKAFWFDL